MNRAVLPSNASFQLLFIKDVDAVGCLVNKTMLAFKGSEESNGCKCDDDQDFNNIEGGEG